MHEREYIYHPWFAHAAMKAVPSATLHDRYDLVRLRQLSRQTPLLDHLTDVYDAHAAPAWQRAANPQSLSDVPIVDDDRGHPHVDTLTRQASIHRPRGHRGRRLIPGEWTGTSRR